MEPSRPSRCELMLAIELYLALAYPGAATPKAVQQRLETLAGAPDETMYDASAFEVDPARPRRRALRLGNRFYPCMKLVVEPAPTGASYLFRADTHDQHVRPTPGTRDAELFSECVKRNQSLAEQIESSWEDAKLPTFKTFLRQDLARRRAAVINVGPLK